eukprot:Gregarina_sp_Poly_1__10215@NODE_708_length_6677_cov_81_679879_g535_i0_p9_GENE_NODE_708_length_6677_cov_81_679879_g535_i0NODE_708_length_6677_cov_81_679879_g535_i0_p9_ORF_typecomplete_len109_score19_14_NODE_708_length_6677_cov_81_679879_g535_i060116337
MFPSSPSSRKTRDSRTSRDRTRKKHSDQTDLIHLQDAFTSEAVVSKSPVSSQLKGGEFLFQQPPSRTTPGLASLDDVFSATSQYPVGDKIAAAFDGLSPDKDDPFARL